MRGDLGEAGCDQLGAAHVRHLSITDVHEQLKLDRFRDADILADQVVERAAEADRIVLVFRDGHGKGEDDAVVIAIVHDLVFDDFYLVRDRPLDLTDPVGGDGGVIVPVHLRRDAGVPGILPVDVPVLVHLEAEAQPDGFAGRCDLALADQFDPRMPAINRLGLARKAPGQCGKREHKSSQKCCHQCVLRFRPETMS